MALVRRSCRSRNSSASWVMSRTMARTSGKAALASETVKYFFLRVGFFLAGIRAPPLFFACGTANSKPLTLTPSRLEDLPAGLKSDHYFLAADGFCGGG